MSNVYFLRLVVGFWFFSSGAFAGEMLLREAKRLLRDLPPPSSRVLRSCATRLLPLEMLARQWVRLGEALRVCRAAPLDWVADVDLAAAGEHVRHLRNVFRFRTSTTAGDVNSTQVVVLLGLVDAVEWSRRAWAIPLEDLRQEIVELKKMVEVYLKRLGSDPRDRTLWAAGDRIHQAGRILEARDSWNPLLRRRVWRETTTVPPAPQARVSFVGTFDDE